MTDQNRNIQELKNQVSKFTQERNWEEYHNPKNLSMSIAIEFSELMEIFQWLNERESWDIMNSLEAKIKRHPVQPEFCRQYWKYQLQIFQAR